jgi:hypothetical protein
MLSLGRSSVKEAGGGGEAPTAGSQGIVLICWSRPTPDARRIDEQTGKCDHKETFHQVKAGVWTTSQFMFQACNM